MYKVLLIEEDVAYQQILQDVFKKEKFGVSVFSDGNQGLLETAKIRPDIILLDIMLPGGTNGFDVLEQLKKNPRTKNIPVIILTNLDSEEKVSKEIGASCYFVKSQVSMAQVVAKIKELLEVRI